MKRRMIALAMALVMCLSLVPTVAFADGHDGQVRVIVENTTYAKTAGAPWEGTLVDEWIDLASNSTMMSCVVDALDKNGYTQTGAENNYISEINGLAEQAGSYNMSGWMGTLNDWFTNKGFGAFTVAAGDEIRIMYTLNGGADIGSNKSNNDKTVKDVTFSAGTLDKVFAPDTNDYTLTVPAGTKSITVTPTASNKNYQVRTFVGETEYKRTAVPVEDDTVITVKCGDPTWPSMNGDSAPAKVYTFTVAKEGDNPDSESHTPITAYVNISKDGALLKDNSGEYTARMKVELDTKTTYTIDDILRAAHAQYAPDGEAAYGSENGAYGLSLTKLWGVENGGNYGYQINAAAREVMGLTTAVANGDTVDACIYENTSPNTEDYTAFTAYTAETETDKPLELTLNSYPYDSNWAMVKTPLSGAVITVDGEATSYTTDADGKVTLTLTEAGEHVISAAKTKTINEKTVTAITAPVCVVTAEAPVISAPEHTVTVSVGPKTVNAFFYTDAAATVPVAADKVVDNGVKGNYHVYTVTLPEGECSYRGEETVSGVVQPIGGEQFTVTEDENQTLNLLRTNFYVNSNAMTHEDDWTLTGLTNESTGKEVVLGAKYPNGTNKIMYQAALLRCGAAYSGSTLTVNENLLEDYYVKAQLAKFTVGATAYSVQNKTLSISAYNRFTLVVPADAEKVEFFQQTANYVVVPMKTSEMTRTEDEINDTVVYAFKSKTTTFSGTMSYRVSEASATTLAGYFANNTTVELKWSDYAPTATASTAAAAYDDNSVLLNVDDGKDTNELAMNVGETFKLRAFRAPWQIVDTTTGNHMIEPDFHFAVLSGSDVVTVTPVTEFEEGKTSGNASGNWMNITATAPGTAVIAVWYDGIEITGSTFNGFYGATAPNRYGYVVVNVGADNTVAITPLTHDGDWDAEFDTVYYVGSEGGTFSFTSDDATSVTVTNLCGITMGSAKAVTKTDDKWNVPVYNGSNLITITSASGTDYRLVRAAQISIGYTDVTTGQTASDLSALTVTAGDTLSLHFNGLHMPIPKMSGIYNPGYMGTAKTAYVLDDSFDLLSAGTQYDFATSAKSDLSFKVPSAGEHTLKGYISLSSMGDPFGNHRNITDAGRTANMNAGEVFGAFGVLPEIQFTAAESDSPVFTYDEVTKVKNIQLIVGGTTEYNYYALFKNEAALNDAANWKSSGWKGLACKVSSDSYYNDMTLRYWYEGETPVTVPLANGVAAILSEEQFTVNTGKILNLQISVAPADPALGSAKLWNYVVYPGSSNLKYVHPVIKSLSVSDGENVLALSPALSYTNTTYSLDVGKSNKISLNAEQLVKIYNTAPTADQSDRVTLTKLCKGEAVDESITVLEMGLPNNPHRNWTVQDLDITNVDALELKVTSYADKSVSRTYHIDLINLMRTSLAVEKIAAIDTVTLESKSAIDAARAAYDALSDAEKAKVTNSAELMDAEAAYANLMAKIYYTAVGNSLLTNAKKSTPTVGSIGGEWLMLGLARSGRSVPAGYYDNVVQYVKAKVNDNERLHNSKSTDNSRVILALTAIGKDPTKVGGHDLTRGLNSMSYLNKQGTNGPVWALIALDSHNYAVSGDDVTREELIDTICRAQMESGGWYISDDDHPVEDVDMTAMAVQALAPYYKKNNADAKSAVDKALAWLASEQGKDGDFGSSESDAQVIVALCALGIDPASNSSFIKGGSSVLSAMCSYYADGESKGFKHTKNGIYDQMATEQCYYALVAYDRFVNGETALYDMSDVHQMTKTAAKAATCTAEGNNEYYTCSACKKVFTDADGKTETTVAAETLTKLGHAMTKTDAKAPTCTADGNDEYWTCSVCKQVFKADKTTLTTVAAETLTKLGHNFTKKVVNDAHLKTSATCTTQAVYYKSCECGEKGTATFASGSTTAHNYGDDGKCTVCGSKNPLAKIDATKVAAVDDSKVSPANAGKIIADNSGLVVKTSGEVTLAEIKDALERGSTVIKGDAANTKEIPSTSNGTAELTALAKTLIGEQKKEVEKLAEKLTSMQKVEMVLDLSVSLQSASGTDLAELTELPAPITVTIPISNEMYQRLQGKTVVILRSHTDVSGDVAVTELAATLGGTGDNYFVQFASDKFSTFALTSYEKVGGGHHGGTVTPVSVKSAPTGDAGVVIYFAMGAMSYIGSAAWIRKRKDEM